LPNIYDFSLSNGMIILSPDVKQTKMSMKIKLLIASIGVLTLSHQLSAQTVTKDSIQLLQQQNESLERSKALNDLKLDLAKIENEYQEKSKQANEVAEKARVSAVENQQAADKLRSNAQDKKLANQAKSAARKAERDARAARKAAEGQEKLMSNITSLQKQIADEEAKLSGNAAGSAYAAAPTETQSAAVAQTAVQAPAAQVQPLQIDNPVRLGNAAEPNAGAKTITERVVESTYKNYPQQAGQPSIIINNIIIPSDYDRPAQAAAAKDPANLAPSNSDAREYEEYLAWKKQRNAQREYVPAEAEAGQREANVMDRDQPMTFKERFGEKPARKSGMWVIPLVGVHASDFKADFSDNEADGRTGWNAGLDFRMHTRRFFVQPGVHYFNSSLRFTNKDSLSTAPLLDGPRIHSLKVPVMLGVYLTKANKGFFKFNIKGGATGNYVIAVDKDNQARFDKDNIEEFSYGLAAGVGLEFGLITLDLSHEWGMSPFLKSNDMKNNVLRATLGLKL
jgi:hypothetical protein